MPPRPRSSTATNANTFDVAISSPANDQARSRSTSTNPRKLEEGQGEEGQLDGMSPGASGSGSKPKKKSQRPSWSCTECTRRKIRCDRVVPGCNQCIKRGKVHLCRLEQDVDLGFGAPPPPTAFTPGGSQTVPNLDPTLPQNQPRLATASEYDAITRSVNVVRQRLCHLERVLKAFVPQSGAFDENGQPMFGINMDMLAATAHLNQQSNGPSIQNGSSTGAGGAMSLPVPPNRSTYAGNGEEYEPREGFRVEGIEGTPASGNNHYPLPPPPASSMGRVREMRDEGRQMAESDGEVEAAVTLEYLALGRDRKEDHFHRAELRRPSFEEDDQSTSPALLPSASLSETAPWPGTVDHNDQGPSKTSPSQLQQSQTSLHPSPFPIDTLPSPELSDFITTYSLDRVCWQHSAVHVGQFRAEHSEFLSWGDKRAELVNQAWLALYFAMLCVGVKHMAAHDAQLGGISPDDLKRLPRLYFDACIAALHRANFLSKHSIYTIQTIVILVVACQDVGGSDLIATLLACGIRIAQHLNIHRFGSDQEWESRRRANGVDPKSQEGIKGLIQRELRKRLWYALTIEDWLSIPFRRAYSVSPTHFTTPLPANCHDSDLSAGNLLQRPHEEPTIVSKILFTYEVAACIRRFFENVNCSTTPGEPSYELCLEVDRQIRQIIEDGPTFLKTEDPVSEDWVKHLRHYYIMSVSHKILICHRVFLGRSFRDPRFAYSRKAAIEAARSVIQELARGSKLPYQLLWTAPFHTIAASTTIILDIFQSSSVDPDTPHKRREVQIALEELKRLSDEGSPIASRGVRLLSTLLAEEAKHPRRSTIPDSRKRKASTSAPGEGERFGDVAKRVVSNSRTSLNGSTYGSTSSLVASPNHSSTPFPYFNPTLSAANGGGLGPFEQQSPVDSHLSDGSLTQDAFEAIWQGLHGYSGPTPGGVGGAAHTNGANGGGGFGMMSPGTAGDAATAEFWRTFDSNLEMLGGFENVDATNSLGFGTSQPTAW